jgi:hypothetical protein
MRALVSIVLAAIFALLTGCATTGLSMRETPGDFSTIALSLHDVAPPSTQPAAPLRPASFPVRLAVAQLGEIAPPEDMLAALREQRDTFIDVQAVPSAMSNYNVAYNYSRRGGHHHSTGDHVGGQLDDRKQAIRQQVDSMRAYARDGGADYLLLFGGTVDRASTSTPLSIFDLTIVGAFIIPSKQIMAEGRAGAALIDVRDGRSVMTFNAQSKGDRLAPTASRDNTELKLVRTLRDELTRDLAKQLTQRIRNLSVPARVAVVN